jgi:hypothetical protein
MHILWSHAVRGEFWGQRLHLILLYMVRVPKEQMLTTCFMMVMAPRQWMVWSLSSSRIDYVYIEF